MCLILLSYRMHSRYPLIFAANRDEFYERPSSPVSFWPDAPDILAGRDLKDGGTWMGITKRGRFAAVTNYRDPASYIEGAPSRGWLVRDFLCDEEGPETYLHHLSLRANQFNGFSLILGDSARLYYFSNRGDMRELSPGLYGLSNRLLDTPWPKVERGKKVLKSVLSRTGSPSPDDIFEILLDQSKPSDDELPETGVGLKWERILSPIFIASPVYGTRSSTVLMIDRKNHVTFVEWVFNAHPEPWMTARFEFRIQADTK